MLEIEGWVNAGCNAAGLFWNYETPEIFDEQQAVWFDIAEGYFSYTLFADFQSENAKLFRCGEKVQEMNYRPAGRRGIFLILREGTLTLWRIQVIKQ